MWNYNLISNEIENHLTFFNAPKHSIIMTLHQKQISLIATDLITNR